MRSYRLNLLEGRVLTPAQRRTGFVVFVGYLVLSGVVLVFVANITTRLMVQAVRDRAQGEALALEWREARPEAPDMFVYERSLRARTTDLQDALGDVDAQVEQRVFLAGILYWLEADLPRGAFIYAVDQNRGKNTFEIKVAVPLRVQSEVDANDLLQTWRENEALTRRLHDLRFVISQRQSLERQTVYIWSYSARLDREKVD